MDLMEFVDGPHAGLDSLKTFLAKDYLQPHPVRAADELPDIAKSRR